MFEPSPLVDLDQIAQTLGVSPVRARALLAVRGEQPVATYRGRPLWLSDTIHDAALAPSVAA
jgi:hypothetical protein